MIGWVDAGTGVAGDMFMAALVAAGADAVAVAAAVSRATGGDASVTFEEVTRCGLAALRAEVVTPETRQPSRNLADVTALITAAALDPSITEHSLTVFDGLARAEAAVHRCDIADVHFHEVGALDAIADIVGAITAWQSLGSPSLVVSTVGVGQGHVTTEHGVLGVPVPAVVAMLVEAGAPSAAGPLAQEAATPTGVALLTHLATRWGPQPAMTLRTAGAGAGSADPAAAPNVTRVLLGEPDDGPYTERVLEIRCNVDDADPRSWPGVLDGILAAGALDAWISPITMKKGRPAQLLAVLCPAELVDPVVTAVFALTPTFGVRVDEVRRIVLDRDWVDVRVDGQPVRVKVGRRNGVPVTAQPEWRDVESAAARLGIAARLVADRARAEATDIV